jgi:hypothetical protein
MKLDAKTASTAVQATTAKGAVQPFKQLLAEARADLKKPLTPVAAASANVVRAQATASASTAVASQVRQQARAHVEAEASRLGTVRADHARHAEAQQNVRAAHTEAVTEKTESRVIDFIVRELNSESTPAANTTPPPTPTAELPTVRNVNAALQASKIEAAPETKASQAVALIEKIVTFVRSQRPGLALTLNNSLGASVEIERIGPKEIALKLIGQFGPPSADAVSRIRDELRARGLKIGALSVA